MSTAVFESPRRLRCHLSFSDVDAQQGIIRGATVAKSGVQAEGKFVWIDAKGAVTYDEALAKRELPIFTDAKTLTTLLVAAKVAGDRVKTREDHNDSIGARAGFSDAFKLDGDRVIADVHLFASYRNRGVLLETAKETPDKVGLSIDFVPSYELLPDRALMRIEQLDAVDLVDAGAITPGGLLLSAGVDTAPKVTAAKTQPSEPMAATLDDIMTALAEMNKANAALLAKLMAPAATPAPDAAALAAVKAESEKLAAALKEQSEQLKTIVAGQAQMKKERALLGFRGTDTERAALATASAEDIEKLTATKKDYLGLVAERVEKMKCKRTEAHIWVMKNHKTEYAEHRRQAILKVTMAAAAA